jgi:hypothetical protein
MRLESSRTSIWARQSGQLWRQQTITSQPVTAASFARSQPPSPLPQCLDSRTEIVRGHSCLSCPPQQPRSFEILAALLPDCLPPGRWPNHSIQARSSVLNPTGEPISSGLPVIGSRSATGSKREFQLATARLLESWRALIPARQRSSEVCPDSGRREIFPVTWSCPSLATDSSVSTD